MARVASDVIEGDRMTLGFDARLRGTRLQQAPFSPRRENVASERPVSQQNGAAACPAHRGSGECARGFRVVLTQDIGSWHVAILERQRKLPPHRRR